jgi:hypothetical protein
LKKLLGIILDVKNKYKKKAPLAEPIDKVQPEGLFFCDHK